jgi:hypothetical protein
MWPAIAARVFLRQQVAVVGELVSAFPNRVPPRLPTPPDRLIGRVLQIPTNRCRYRDRDLALLVKHVRLDISQWYGGDWVWLEGDEVDEHGQLLSWTSALVHVSACTISPPGAQ